MPATNWRSSDRTTPSTRITVSPRRVRKFTYSYHTPLSSTYMNTLPVAASVSTRDTLRWAGKIDSSSPSCPTEAVPMTCRAPSPKTRMESDGDKDSSVRGEEEPLETPAPA